MSKKLSFLISILLLKTTLFAQAPRSYTSSEILLQLKKLNTVGSVLYIAAHPDDENTRLIAYLANEKCLRTGYLSLTRGDGGQNLIGPEQGIELGVIRTQELLAARRIDGGEQYFTRAYDFGFSKTPEETFTKWNKDSVLSDVVWVIRNFRPDIIITRFATDGSGGHGHHTASAILAEEAFDAAADSTRFPEQLRYVSVWKTRRMFYNTVARFRDPNADMSKYIKLDVGGYNPLLGKSYGEIAAESRSMHKSQGFGSARQRGEFLEHFKPVKGDTAGLKDIFEGIDFSWNRVKGGRLVESLVFETIQKFNPQKPEQSVENLVEIKLLLDRDLNNKKTYNYDLLEDLLLNCTGQYQEAIAPEYNYSIDARFSYIHYSLKRRSESEITQTTIKKDSITIKPISITPHYWLKDKIQNNMFKTESRWFGNAEYPPITLNFFTTEFNTKNKGLYHIDLMTNARVNNSSLRWRSHNIQYKWVDPEKGELYRPVVITPPVMINIMNDVLVFSDGKAKQVKIKVKAGKDNVKGELSLAGQNTYNAVSMINTPQVVNLENETVTITPASQTFELAKKGDEKEFIFNLEAPAEAITTLKFAASIDGVEYSKGIKEIKYDHIPVQTLFPEAEVKLVKLDVKKKLKRIGYIPGAGDEVQACLTQLGYEVVTLTDDKLASENLGQYEAIITGVRAYNTNDKLPSFKQKLMDYVAAGGNLIVQYNTNSWAGPLNSDIGPYPFKITRDRITDEEAKVNFELPNHPVLNFPNKITQKDFEGWIQERSIYHASDFGAMYDAPLGMADPGEKSNKGALIIAKHGKGNFVYTGLAFFRELPAGVPGAYRLMVNLIELGK